MPEKRELPYADVDIAAVRTYANRRANDSSVRQIARRIGVRHTSLEKFLAGSEPYAKNRALICEWYLREHRVHPVRHTAREISAGARAPESLLDGLLIELRGEARTEARMRITTALAQAYARMGKHVPDWLYSAR